MSPRYGSGPSISRQPSPLITPTPNATNGLNGPAVFLDGSAPGPSRWRSVVGTGAGTLLLPFAVGGLLFLIVRLPPIAVWVISQLPPGRDLLSLYALCLPLVGIVGARAGFLLAERSWRAVGWLAGACGLFAFLFLWQIYPILTFRAEAYYKKPAVKRPAPKDPQRRKTTPTPQRTTHHHASDPGVVVFATIAPNRFA